MGGMTWTRCFSSLGCPDLPLDAIFALAVRHRVPAVELRAVGGTVELADYFARQHGSPAKLAERLRTAPVRIVALDGSLHLSGATAAERDQLAAYGAWADGLGIAWIRVFDGGRTADEAELAAAVETLRWWQDLRHERGWRTDLMVETHDSLFSAEKINRFLAAAPGTAILWDAHHTWRKGGEDPVVTWRAIRSHVVHVHVKDSIGVPSARHPFTYVLPGDGGFPIAPLLAALRADDYRGGVSLEWEKLWHPYLPPLEDALRVAAERGWW
jgi:sugar phosphate isomerase/epimerase